MGYACDARQENDDAGDTNDDNALNDDKDEAQTAAAESADEFILTTTAPAPVRPPALTSESGLPLMAVKTTSNEWTDDDMTLNWTQQMTVQRLQLLRDFFVEGMTVSVVEEKVCCKHC